VSTGLDPRCEAARVWISAAIDAEATESERAALRLHLAECSLCRSWAAQAESVSLQVRTSAPVEPARPFAFPEPEVVAPAPAPLRQRRRVRRAYVAAVASPLVAAAAVAGVLFSGALQPGQRETKVPLPPALTVAVNEQGLVAGSPVNGPTDVLPRDRRLPQSLPERIPRNRALPGS
jgi:predicted anti-sigma-YlaC factor YlaD